MARILRMDEYKAKRREILDAAHRLVFTKGFDQMSIRDIQVQLNISSGAFHHYFGSREALLQAYIERIKEESGKPLQPLIQNSSLNAIQKLQGFLDTLDSLRSGQLEQVLALIKVWYTGSNLSVRQKVDEAILAQRTPWIAGIIQQGIDEGIFQVTHPQNTAGIILALLQSMGNTHARLLLAIADALAKNEEQQVAALVGEIVTTQADYMDAIERVLGAPHNSLSRADKDAVTLWVTGLRNMNKETIE